MARPFPNTFDKDSPMSPQSAISYQTNVNRQKTKKWTEAKAVDYGGDDWGDDDDYDLPPPPISKPTGLRQPSQALAGSSKAESPVVDNSRKYGDLPPLPGAGGSRPRANSFDADDERRDFSSSSSQPPPAMNAPATRFSQITGTPTPRIASGPPALSISTQQPAQPPAGLRNPTDVSPVVESPHPDVLMPGPGRVNTGESSITSPVSEIRTPSTSSDFHARRDFSPSAVPPPLSTRASPGPQSATDTTPSQRFPARKSSLSQVSGPPLDEIMGVGSQDTTPKPWIGARPASPGTGAKSPVSPSKALPFIRPADIYRRAEEERRQSIESAGRPSMDSLMGSKASDRSDSPSKPYLKGGPEIGAGKRRASFENDDSSDSGRRLMPMLEPVKERKSEYGFEGFNVNDHGPHEGQSQFREQSLQSRYLDVEEVRRQSTSPKLPDLTRMSGFGMDMFAAKDVEAINKETESTPTAVSLSSPEQDLKLRNQPSFGFKSVVHQAFDTTDDHSLPDTPASRSGSGVNRTDSESTGTGGISPIMSRVSSTAVPETRNRDISTTAILEATEPNSPETIGNVSSRGDTFDAPQAPGFKPGHRRDISAPSPGNSPARTPDLATSHILPGSQHAIVDDTPADVASPTVEEPLQAPRPFAEREHSFRPSLPGGWTSYATTARSETPSQPAVATPITEVAPAHDDEDYDLTPTTTKRSLPQSALGASIAGATLGGAALGRHDHTSPSQTPVNETPRAVLGGSPLSSPGSVTSPTGSMYPSQQLEGNLPTLEQAPAETQLRPDVVDRPISTQSIGPPPPPKDTPTGEALHESSDYFPKSAIPTVDNTEVEEISESPTRQQIIPTLSTDSADYDEENDKLRKEIVNSLTPTPSNATAPASTAVSDRVDESSFSNPNRESSYLPSEYDNYWATTDQDEEVPTIPDVHRDASDTRPSTSGTSHPGLESPVPAPLSPRRPDESLHPPRPPLQSRFSWEQSSEDVSANVNRAQGYLATDTSASGPMASELPGSVIPVEEEKQVAPQSPELNIAGSDLSDDHLGARDAALLAGGAALMGGATTVTYSDRPEEKSRRLSLAEEKDPQVSSNPVSPTPPEDEHPSRSPQQHFTTSPELYQHPPAPPSTVSPVTSSVHPFAPPPAPTGRLIAFREIVAMKSPQERIKTFDETRHRFAAMDSGLNDWIVKLQGQFPEEHGGVTGSWGSSRGSMPSGSARGRFSKATTGGPAPPLQQPYYQQYLNASSPPAPSTPVSGGSRPGPSIPSGSQQGFSSAGSKMSTQQVQAKGKELLHTAGIFGGKAGKAGKGLLAKGKNKLRAAGGGDKTSPPSNPKADRRSSWGLPLSMSRSSGRPDTMSRNSRESNPTSTLNRPRTNTMPSERSSPAPQLPAVATGYSLGVMSGALSSEHPETPRETLTIQPIPSTSTSNHTATVEPDSKARDTLGVPAPIGKHQPTWDPFNATPIAEEDGFQYEERPKPRLSSDPNSIPDGLSGPADNLAKSDRSNSLDVPFFDAREASDDINNDWVMVDPEPEARGSIAGPSVSKLPSSADPAVRQSLDKPTTSILDRPRGSCSQDASPQIPAQTKAEADVSESVDGGPTTSILNRPRGSFSYDTPPSTSPAKPMTSTLTGPLLNNPTQSTQPIERPATPPAPVVSTLPAAVQRTPSPQKSAQVQPEKQSGASSFLPPIRRTSTFGIGFGSRQPKQRFAIEEDDEASPPRVSGFQQQHFAGEISMGMEQPRPGSENSRSLAGAAIGAAAVAAITSHEKDRKGDQAMTTRDSAVAETQRPFSFHQSSAAPLAYPEQPALTAEAEDLRPLDDTNTWGVRDELVPNMNHPPIPESPGKQRKSSFPPPGFITDPAPFKDHAEGQQSSSEQVFAEEPEELSPRGDTNTWGVGNEMPPSMIQAPLPGISGQQRQASFPPPGFAVDPEAHGPSQIIQPVDVKAPTFKQPLTVDTGASTQSQRQASFPPPGFKVDPQAHGPAEAIRGVSLTDVAPRTPAHARANSNESAPRPLSFQQTPPRESGHQRQPSLPLSFTREPEEIGPRAGNIEEGSLTHGSDSQGHVSIPPSFSRDPEKEELAPPQRSPRRMSIQASPQQSLPQRDPIKTMFTPPRADNILQRPEFKESQVEWRPNRPRVVTKPSQSSYSSESYGKETGILAARTNSWDTQPPPRAYSGSSSYMQRQDSQFSEKGGWASPQQSKPFEQPPSSAQRYPELFKPGQQQSVVESPRDADLPAHYYQAPISRTQAFLPRQQTNEYQLPGVGPPEEPPVNPSRRNSGFLRDIGGRLSRNSSRERRNSISRDQDRLSPERGLESRGEYAESSVMSEDGQERKKRRASFFGHLSRNSYSGQSPPKSRESIIAHHAGSRTDLLVTPQPSPVKRSFFGGSSSEQKSTPKKLIRQSTTGTMDSPAKKKEKNRFSALGGFFGKPSPAKTPLQQPQATRELSHGERQPIESPQPEPQQQRTPSKYQTPDKAQVRAESQSRRGVLSKLSASVALPQEKEKDKSRRPSAAGLLNGFMGRKSYQKDRGSDDSRSQGSQPQLGPQPLLSQTYTDLQEPEPPNQRQRQDSPFQRRQSQEQQYHPQQQVQSRSQPREIPFQDPSLIDQDRGRRVSREPQYDSVPIPGGYSLVRGQGAMAVPTEYDPRGLSRLQQLQSQQQVDPRYIQPQAQLYVPNQGSRLSYQSANLSPHGQGQQAYSAQYTEQPHQQQALSQPQPQLGALETYRDYTNSNNRISREDILARSPPKPLHDQQRPYQISLPGGEIEDDEDVVSTPSRSQHANLSPNPAVSTSTSGRRPQHDSIVRLQQPVIRHPESPAGYPLPEDTVFSPVNPTAVDFPPPPPPKWPSHLDANPQAQVQYQNQQQRQSHDRHVSLSASDLDIDGDLDRSNTRRTAVSAISGISVPRPRSGGSQNGAVGGGGGLNVPTQEEAGSRGGVGVGGRGVSPSPTPPSPMDGDEVRRTDVQIPPRASMEDLYNASPRLPRSGSGFAESESRFNEYGNSNGHADANGRPSGKENSRLDIPREVSRERQYQGNGNGNGGAKHPEEKIYYDSAYRGQARGVGQDGPAELEDHETSMSATSYPGQEWNPYAMGAWDDGVDDVGPSFR